MSISTEESMYTTVSEEDNWSAEWQREHEKMNEYNTYNKHYIESRNHSHFLQYIYFSDDDEI
jgi:hypothetical protein